MKLLIVESPKKCETITRYLGSDFTVMASEGHIRDLSTKGKGGLGIDIDAGFLPRWEISKSRYNIVKKLKDAAKNAEEVYLATDPDREGEAISYHLAAVLGLDIEKTKRLRFHEITKPAILAALEEPSIVDMNLVEAQEARRMEDRIIGFDVSGLMKKKIGERSAGRVQSATLAMIVERQRAIDAFVPEEYWTIDIQVKLGKKTFKASLSKVDGQPFKCSSKEETDAILARIPQELLVSSIAKKEVITQPKPVFKTSSLQQEAFHKFHFSNSKTQSVAQKLYEGLNVNGEHVGLITYMRTDSIRISPEFFNRHAKPYILEVYGPEYVGSMPVVKAPKKGENVQDAHEGIRPTGTHRTPEVVAKYVSADEAKLYRLIYCRAMASLMAPKKSEKTTITLSGNGLEFTLSGSRTLFKGFEVIYGEFDDEEEALLPEVEEGSYQAIVSIDPQQKFTKPEPPYNEASIVKAMEEKGIGRPSTYASTIDTLLKRKYVTATKGVLNPSEGGYKVVDWLTNYFPDIVSSDYTANMEMKLDRVEQGEMSCIEAMDDFYTPFRDGFIVAKERIEEVAEDETGELCPECGRPLVRKRNKKGQEFVGCSGFPTCKYIQKEKEEFVGRDCPLCGKPLVYKRNRKGDRFIGCSDYPNCRYTANENGEVVAKKEKPTFSEEDYLGVCPTCKTGHLVVKQGKKVKFIGCTNFPRCRHVEWLDKKEKNDK